MKEKCKSYYDSLYPDSSEINDNIRPGSEENDEKNHHGKFCIALPYEHRDYMTLLGLMIAEDPGIWEDVTDFLMSGCKRIFRSARRRPPITCFDEFDTDRDQFEYLKAKLEHKPECVEDLVQHLYNDRD